MKAGSPAGLPAPHAAGSFFLRPPSTVDERKIQIKSELRRGNEAGLRSVIQPRFDFCNAIQPVRCRKKCCVPLCSTPAPVLQQGEESELQNAWEGLHLVENHDRASQIMHAAQLCGTFGEKAFEESHRRGHNDRDIPVFRSSALQGIPVGSSSSLSKLTKWSFSCEAVQSLRNGVRARRLFQEHR